MNISFLGGAREVGRSCVLLHGRKNILLDCGIKLDEDEEYPLLEGRLIRRLDAVVLSHAHLDHSGYLPELFESGYRGKVYLTKPTRDLIQLLLADYLRINEGESPYRERDVKKLLANTVMQEYGEGKEIVFRNAGHILGSAMVEIVAEGKKILYTGDINVRPSRLLEGAEKNLSADVLIIESTYGSRSDTHVPAKEASRLLAESIRRTFDKGGLVIIPTFAIGRGQEILFTLESFIRSKAMHETPIYLDGMIRKALRIYRHNANWLKKEVQLRILTSDDDPFKSEYYRIPETKTREDVVSQERAVILATSGMLNGGPVLTYIKHLAPNPKNKIILVGFQAKGTRGRELLEGADELLIDEERVPINLEFDQAPFSGHSDQKELLEFVRSVKGLKKVFVMHGEGEKPLELAEAIRAQAGKSRQKIEVIVPELGETCSV